MTDPMLDHVLLQAFLRLAISADRNLERHRRERAEERRRLAAMAGGRRSKAA